MWYIKLFIERVKNIGQSAPECPFKAKASTIKAKAVAPKAYKHAASAEIKIHSMSDSLTG